MSNPETAVVGAFGAIGLFFAYRIYCLFAAPVRPANAGRTFLLYLVFACTFTGLSLEMASIPKPSPWGSTRSETNRN